MEDKSAFLDYLTTVYDQCHNHLLEQGKKRDQLITFYIILFSFVITTGPTISKTLMHSHSLTVIYCVLIVIGILVVVNMADLRSWHQQYLNAIQIINWVEAHQSDYEQVDVLKADIKTLVKHHKDNPKRFFLLRTTDNIVLFGMAILSTIPLIPVLLQFKLTISLIIGIYAVFTLFYLILVQHYLKRKLSEGDRYNTWILDFNYGDNILNQVLFKNDYMKITTNHDMPVVEQKSGGVVILPMIADQFVFLEIKRVDGNHHLELPRGYREKSDVNSIFAAERELYEELSIDATNVQFSKVNLGKVMPDSGFIKSDVEVVMIQLNTKPENIKLQKAEHIKGYQILTEAEVQEKVQNNQITDSFSLAALYKYQVLKQRNVVEKND